MSDNLPKTLQQPVQDVIAPDVHELKVRLASLEKQNDVQFAALWQESNSFQKQSDLQFTSLRQEMVSGFKAILSAI